MDAAFPYGLAVEVLAAIEEAVVILTPEMRVMYSNRAAREKLGAESLALEARQWEALLAQSGSGSEGLLTRVQEVFGAKGELQARILVFRTPSASATKPQKLEALESQRRAILDSIPDLAWLKDERSRFINVNRTWLEVYGKERVEDVVGTSDFDHSPDEFARRYVADDQTVLRTGKPLKVEELFVTRRGITVWIETIKTPIFDADGRVIGTAGIARDIDERKQREKSMQLSQGELERSIAQRNHDLAKAHEALARQERLAVLGQLAGGVAHQIRNPLGAITNAATYLAPLVRKAGLGTDAEAAIRIIQEELRQADDVITGLLDYARVRSPERRPVLLTTLIDEVLSAENLPENVVLERCEVPVEAMALDATQIRGAISVLVRNALEAMPEGGRLRIELQRDHAPSGVRLSVTDSGTGISPRIRERLFEPLVTTKPTGIGLGLVTARSLVEAHGGRLTLVEAPSGTRFELWLPVAPH